MYGSRDVLGCSRRAGRSSRSRLRPGAAQAAMRSSQDGPGVHTVDMPVLAAALAAAAACPRRAPRRSAEHRTCSCREQVGPGLPLLQRDDGPDREAHARPLRHDRLSERGASRRPAAGQLPAPERHARALERNRPVQGGRRDRQAMREVIAHAVNVRTSRSAGRAVPAAATFTITLLKDATCSRATSPSACAPRASSTGRSIDQTFYAVYQRFGNVLSGVYSFGAKAGQEAFCLHAAEQSALNLRHLAPPRCRAAGLTHA